MKTQNTSDFSEINIDAREAKRSCSNQAKNNIKLPKQNEKVKEN